VEITENAVIILADADAIPQTHLARTSPHHFLAESWLYLPPLDLAPFLRPQAARHSHLLSKKPLIDLVPLIVFSALVCFPLSFPFDHPFFLNPDLYTAAHATKVQRQSRIIYVELSGVPPCVSHFLLPILDPISPAVQRRTLSP